MPVYNGDVLFIHRDVSTMIWTMTAPETLKLTQYRCVVAPEDTSLVALSLFGGVAEPVGRHKNMPLCLEVMCSVLGKYAIVPNLNGSDPAPSGTQTHMVNFFSGANLAARRESYAILDTITAAYYRRDGAGQNTFGTIAYATLSVNHGYVDDAYLALNGTTIGQGQLATVWRSQHTPAHDAGKDAETITDLFVDAFSDASPPHSCADTEYVGHLFATHTAQPNPQGYISGFATKFAPSYDPAWSLKPDWRGADLDRDVLARDLETTAVHRVVELDMRRDFVADIRKDEQW